MTCSPERVTGYVDGALSDVDRAEVEAHLASCAACSEQVRAERALRERLRALPAVDLPAGLEETVRRRLRRGPWAQRVARRLLPLAAGLGVLVMWGRGSPPVVARELALDHLKCFRKATVPAKVFSNDPAQVRSWFDARGTRTPLLPEGANGLEILGARHCPLLDGSSVAHVYYTGEGPRRISLYVVDRNLRLAGTYRTSTLGETVQLFRAGGLNVGVVGEKGEDVEAFHRRFLTSVATSVMMSPPLRQPAQSRSDLAPSPLSAPLDPLRLALLR
jgi:anti-sigma factor RsiW